MDNKCDTCVYKSCEPYDEPCTRCEQNNPDENETNYKSTAKHSREECLVMANNCVNGSRAEQYGDLEDNFETISRFWNGYLSSVMMLRNAHPLTPVDVANMMVLLKVARSSSNPAHGDNYVDIAGYAACAYELTQRGE